ncbi:AAA+ ATPase [Helicosporidium sp. ATCC 50920]|nr:AAA+ ATPase [Helicosporidium sp. ATCC 50920]|eukprot:KDD77104.1 AAA+ ATPase [Helicosporidium sp. ATCC 50920]
MALGRPVQSRSRETWRPRALARAASTRPLRRLSRSPALQAHDARRTESGARSDPQAAQAGSCPASTTLSPLTRRLLLSMLAGAAACCAAACHRAGSLGLVQSPETPSAPPVSEQRFCRESRNASTAVSARAPLGPALQLAYDSYAEGEEEEDEDDYAEDYDETGAHAGEEGEIEGAWSGGSKPPPFREGSLASLLATVEEEDESGEALEGEASEEEEAEAEARDEVEDPTASLQLPGRSWGVDPRKLQASSSARWVSDDEAERLAGEALDAMPEGLALSQALLGYADASHRVGPPETRPRTSQVPDLAAVPSHDKVLETASTAWNSQGLRTPSYTQLWELVRERHVESAAFTRSHRSLDVVTRRSCPGGRRRFQVGVPHDPELMRHLVGHGVRVSVPVDDRALAMVEALALQTVPIIVAAVLVRALRSQGFREFLARRSAGFSLKQLTRETGAATFADIEGIDAIKEEINEVVAYLREPERFAAMGVRSPAGILLVGAPGMGKTLLARAIAGEARVPFFSVGGSEFGDLYVGVGASRIRQVFHTARKHVPCIVFIDEFDGLGQRRDDGQGGGAADSDSVATVNQLLAELDGFEDNSGLVVIAATNRPEDLDPAAIRPGRFDRIITLPLPNFQGRVDILGVHARERRLEPDVSLEALARATPGFTGAQLMGLMNGAATLAAREQCERIASRHLFLALDDALRQVAGQDVGGPPRGAGGGVLGTSISKPANGDSEAPEPVPAPVRRMFAVYEAGKILTAHCLPAYDQLQRVGVCVAGHPGGHSYFLPSDERLEAQVTLRSQMEAQLVVALAGRCAQRLALGDAHVNSTGAAELYYANYVAREMVFRCGFGRRLGPVALQAQNADMLNSRAMPIADLSTELAMVAQRDVQEILEAAEAKAYYGLVANYEALKNLFAIFMRTDEMTGDEFRAYMQTQQVKPFASTRLEGFGWDERGSLVWPDKAAPSDGEELLPPPGPEDKPLWWSGSSPYSFPSDAISLLHGPSGDERQRSLGMRAL